MFKMDLLKFFSKHFVCLTYINDPTRPSVAAVVHPCILSSLPCTLFAVPTRGVAALEKCHGNSLTPCWYGKIPVTGPERESSGSGRCGRRAENSLVAVGASRTMQPAAIHGIIFRILPCFRSANVS